MTARPQAWYLPRCTLLLHHKSFSPINTKHNILCMCIWASDISTFRCVSVILDYMLLSLSVTEFCIGRTLWGPCSSAGIPVWHRMPGVATGLTCADVLEVVTLDPLLIEVVSNAHVCFWDLVSGQLPYNPVCKFPKISWFSSCCLHCIHSLFPLTRKTLIWWWECILWLGTMLLVAIPPGLQDLGWANLQPIPMSLCQ